ncbi:MAG TPA: ribosome small subunit-dependent GTPase A [Bacteroidales bacterium]|nr:ribosome small subunit-dependent GTPase A [Bacteroidales bacterium]
MGKIIKGTVIKSTGSWYSVIDETGNKLECRLRGKLKISGIKSTNPIAVGDQVYIRINPDDESAIITAIADRRNYIIRKATNLSRQTHIIAANIDQAMVIVTLAEPRTSTGFIDRFLVTCEAYSIPAIIVFNKIDLYDNENLYFFGKLVEIYKNAGYQTIGVSAVTRQNLSLFEEALKNKTTLLSGYSGVGKSTLINAIVPGLNLKVQSISQAHSKGRHTTTFAEMYKLHNNTFIIDTPGIKEFGLADFEPWELSHYFPEMRSLFNLCRFDNCTHYNEPQCMVKEAVNNRTISLERYQNYIGMLLDNETRK